MNDTIYSFLPFCFVLCVFLSIRNWHKYFVYKKDANEIVAGSYSDDDNEEVNSIIGNVHRYYLCFAIISSLFTIMTFVSVLCSYVRLL